MMDNETTRRPYRCVSLAVYGSFCGGLGVENDNRATGHEACGSWREAPEESVYEHHFGYWDDPVKRSIIVAWRSEIIRGTVAVT